MKKRWYQLIILLVIAVSCNAQSLFWYKLGFTPGDFKYITPEAVHTTPEAKKKYEQYKESFLKSWLIKTNCYMPFRFKSPIKNDTLTWTTMTSLFEEITVDNIFFTSNYDTALVVMAAYFGAKTLNNGVYIPEYTYSSIMGAKIDINGKWNFICPKPTQMYSSSGDTRKDAIKDYKFIMLKWGQLLTKDKKIDPTFFRRFFTDPKVFVKDKS